MESLVTSIESALCDGPGWRVLDGSEWPALGATASERDLVEFAFALGVPLSQNGIGEMCCRVEDRGVLQERATARGYLTGEALPLHNDRSDVLILHCVREASGQGGDTTLVRIDEIHSILQASAPLSCEVLRRPLPYDLRGSHREGERQWIEIPVFSGEGGSLRGWYCRRFIESCERFDDCPRLSAVQREALDTLDGLIEEKNLIERVHLKAGQTLVLNNHRVLHGRTSIQENTPEAKRLMYRLWVSPPWSPELSSEYLPLFGRLSPGAYRGGVWPQTAGLDTYPIDLSSARAVIRKAVASWNQ
jgi:hypothetical protein